MSDNIDSTDSFLKEDTQIKRLVNARYTSKSLSHLKKKNKDEQNKLKLDDGSDNEDHNTCIVCAERIFLASISPCNHRVCHVCSFRQRALYLKKQCLVCRTENENLVFTEDLSLNDFESIKKSRFIPKFPNDYGIRYTSDYAKEETLNLLKFSCPIKSCSLYSKHLSNFKELNEHTREVHNKVYCPLCAKFKKAFISELTLYSPKQLQVHQSRGDQEGFNGHPLCKFCSGKRFYSDDELFIHMREKHEKCHICDQINPNSPQYFKNYDHLAQHFRDAHYVCNVQSCLDQKFVVFRDDFDLQAHMIKEHSNVFGGDNLLFSNSQLKFGSQLSTFETNTNRKTKKKTSVESDNRDSYQIKKMRLEERAKHYLNYSQSGFDKFLVANTKYGNNEIDANELFKEYKLIFKNGHEVDYGILIYELASLFPAKSSLKKNLEEINSSELKQKQLEEQFPELPGVDSSPSLLSNNWNSNSTTSLKSIPNRSGSSVSIKTSSKLSRKTYSLPALPKTNAVVFDSSPITRNPSWLTSTERPKTRGISTNPMPINAISIPGFTPKSVNSHKSHKTTNVWSSKKPSTSISQSPKIKPSSDNKNATVNYEFVPKLQNNKPIDEIKFPKLPEAQKKKPPPRVNPVNSSIGQWGSGPNPIIQHLESDPFGMNDLQVSLKNTKKKKGKQVLYHIGI